MKSLAFGFALAVAFSGCAQLNSLFVKNKEKVYCTLPSGVLERYEKVKIANLAEKESDKCRDCSIMLNPNNGIDLSKEKPVETGEKQSFNELYNQNLYVDYTTCEERLRAYNQALRLFQENYWSDNPSNLTLNAYVDERLAKKDYAKINDAEHNVFDRFQEFMKEKLKSRGIAVKFREY